MINYLNDLENIMTGLVLHSKKLYCASHFYFVGQINLYFKNTSLCLFLEIKIATTYLLYVLPQDSLFGLNSDFNCFYLSSLCEYLDVMFLFYSGNTDFYTPFPLRHTVTCDIVLAKAVCFHLILYSFVITCRQPNNCFTLFSPLTQLFVTLLENVYH